MLRSWLEKPLLDPVEITRRHGAVEELVSSVIIRGELEEALRDVTELERAMTRIVTGTVNCRDLLGLARGFRALPEVKAQLQKCESPLLRKLEQQIEEMKELRHTIEKFRAEASLNAARQVLTAAKDMGGLHVVTLSRSGMDANALRQMGDILRDKDPSVVAVLSSVNGEKVTFLAVCGKDAVAKGIKAGDLVKLVSGICGGKGGGKPDSAMGGGTDILKGDDALAAVDNFVAEKTN